MFSGLAFCADCSTRLYHCWSTSWTHEQECCTCATYRMQKNCTAHYIRAVVLEQLVLQNLQRVVAYAQEDEDEFVRRVMENKTAIKRTEQEQIKRKLNKQERRIHELDTIIQRLYE
ncbi:MAG: recombinase, partial [Oscillibacter sp.]|nr:recombinase [Oscillibacter sp.]